jgi:hypothetical protein
MKHDFSDRSHDQPAELEISLLDRLWISAGGAEPETAVKHCSKKEISDFKALGLVLLGSSCLTAVTATTVFHLAMGNGGFHPFFAVGGIAIGALQGVIDNVLQYRGTIYAKGSAELRRAGIKLPEILGPGSASAIVRLVRILQGAALGALGGLCLTLAALSPDTHAYVDNKFLTDNRVAAAEMTKIVDASITRAQDDLKAETTHVDQLNRMLSSLRQDNVRRIVHTSGRSAAPSVSTSDGQIATLERTLADATSKRDALKETLATQTADRNPAIEKAILTAPTHVEKRGGLSGQLAALSDLTKDDPKLLLLILAFEAISFALELGPMWCAARYLPSAYAARVTLQHFIEVTKLAKEGARELGASEGAREKSDEAPAASSKTATTDNVRPAAMPGANNEAANDNHPSTSELNGAKPRRPVGRPLGSKTRSRKNGLRKNGLNNSSGENGHD